MRNKTLAAREHPHPNPLPQAGAGAGFCSLSRKRERGPGIAPSPASGRGAGYCSFSRLRERAGVRVAGQQPASFLCERRTPGADKGLGCSQANVVLPLCLTPGGGDVEDISWVCSGNTVRHVRFFALLNEGLCTSATAWNHATNHRRDARRFEMRANPRSLEQWRDAFWDVVCNA